MKHFCLLLGLLAILGGCATQEGEFSWITHTWTTDRGVFALDHISKRKVDVTKAVKRPYLGETYTFENEAHAKVFDGHPWSYLYCDNVCLEGHPDRTDQN